MVKKLFSKKRASINENDDIRILPLQSIDQYIENHGVRYNKEYLDNLMTTKVPFEKIIVKYTSNTWYGKLHHWYNKNNKNKNPLNP